MSFAPRVSDELELAGVTWILPPHPSAPHAAWSRAGSTSIIYRLDDPDRSSARRPSRALKIFSPAYRGPLHAQRAQALADIGRLDGLQAAERVVLTARMSEYPGLIGSLIMPWIEGHNWGDVVRVRSTLLPEQASHFARALAGVLNALEERGLAHCNLSGGNVMISPQKAGGPPTVQLVDLEHMFGPSFPEAQPPSPDTAPSSRLIEGKPAWRAHADRFSGAIIIGEMLGWWDATVQQAAAETTYFSAVDVASVTLPSRAKTLLASLRNKWGERIASLFEAAWKADGPWNAPSFRDWLDALPQPAPEREDLSSAKEDRNATGEDASTDDGGSTIEFRTPVGAAETARFATPSIAASSADTLKFSTPGAVPIAAETGRFPTPQIPFPAASAVTPPALHELNVPPPPTATASRPLETPASAAPTTPVTPASGQKWLDVERAPTRIKSVTSAVKTKRSAPAMVFAMMTFAALLGIAVYYIITLQPPVRPAASPQPASSASMALASPSLLPGSPAAPLPPLITTGRFLHDPVMCNGVDAQYHPIQKVEVYDPFATFYCSVKASGTPLGQVVAFELRTPQGQMVYSRARVAAAGESYLAAAFRPPEGTQAWPLGLYDLRISIDGTTDQELRFLVGASPK